MSATARVAAALGVVAFACYAAVLPPSFAFWDTGELQTVATILGIAHPPACPAFVLLGFVATHVLPFGEPAWRVTVMCAAAVAVAVAACYAVARRFAVPPVVAAIVTLGFAFASLTLRDATRTEVQDLALALRVVALACALRFYDTGSTRALLGTALATGLAGATHGVALLLVPSVAILVFARSEARDPRRLVLAAACLALGLAPYAYLPLRSAWLGAHAVDPTLALGLAPGASAFWDYDHPATLANFVRVFTAADFNVHSGFAGFLDLARYPAFAEALIARVAAAYGIAGAVLAMLGFALLAFARRADRLALFLAAVLPVPYTQSYADLQDPDRYYLFSLWCAAIAIGVAYEPIVDLVAARTRSVLRCVALALLVTSFVSPAPGRAAIVEQRDDRHAEVYTDEVRAIVPDGAIVLADWAYATPLAYVSYVRHAFGTRTVVAASAEQYVAHYPAWLRSREIYVVSFNPGLVLPGYRCTALKRSSYTVYRVTRT